MSFFFSLAAASAAFQVAIADVPAKYLAPKPAPSAALAKVNGVPITAKEVEPLLWDWRAYEATQDLITYRMLTAEARKVGATVSEEQIEAELARQIEAVRKKLRQGDSLERSLLEQGFPKSRLYLRIRSQLLLDAITLKAFKPEDFVEVSTILIKPRSEQASDLAEAIRMAEASYDELKKGGSWDAVLRRFHNDPQILQSHGRIGWRPLSLFPETVRKEILSIKPGEVSKPAQTANGIQIFRLDALGSSANAESLKKLREEYLAGRRQQTLDRIRKEAKIEVLIPTPAGKPN